MKRSERYNDAEESFRLAYQGEQSKMWTSIPGIVDSVDLDTQTLSVQPSIQGIVLDEQSNATNVNLPLCVDVPIVWPRAGGFSLTFPIKTGDEVLLVFAIGPPDTWKVREIMAPFSMSILHSNIAWIGPKRSTLTKFTQHAPSARKKHKKT